MILYTTTISGGVNFTISKFPICETQGGLLAPELDYRQDIRISRDSVPFSYTTTP